MYVLIEYILLKHSDNSYDTKYIYNVCINRVSDILLHYSKHSYDTKYIYNVCINRVSDILF